MPEQSVRQTVRKAARAGQAERQRERAERDRWFAVLAVDVLTAIGERDAAVADTEHRAGHALQIMTAGEGLTVAEAVDWCAGKLTVREAARLRRLADPTGHRPDQPRHARSVHPPHAHPAP